MNTQIKNFAISVDGSEVVPLTIFVQNNPELSEETITAAWVETTTELAKYFDDAVTNPASMGRAQINIGAPAPDVTARFTCGCCGNGFKGNVAEQLKFDQDNGYGICDGCAKYYS